MKTFVILACVFVAAQAMSWESFKAKHGKSYSKAEEAKRQGIYTANLKKIQEHNKRFENGEVSYNLAVNKYADLTNKEFTSMLNGHKGKKVQNNKIYKPVGSSPSSVDWRNEGAVTDVKDQGQCGSCWSFSTTGSIEGQNFLKNGELISFSEQQLVDCSEDYGNNGCNGGLMDSAFQYIRDYGLETEDDYPYTAEDGSCAYDESSVALSTISSFVDVASGDEDALMDAVANVGPISVAIDASNESFQFYSSGVYDEPDCSSSQLDHGVLAVGYGSEDGNDYWLVKNSWGPDWGEDGYIKMSRNSDNQCGIATMASYPEL